MELALRRNQRAASSTLPPCPHPRAAPAARGARRSAWPRSCASRRGPARACPPSPSWARPSASRHAAGEAASQLAGACGLAMRECIQSRAAARLTAHPPATSPFPSCAAGPGGCGHRGVLLPGRRVTTDGTPPRRVHGMAWPQPTASLRVHGIAAAAQCSTRHTCSMTFDLIRLCELVQGTIRKGPPCGSEF